VLIRVDVEKRFIGAVITEGAAAGEGFSGATILRRK